MIALADNDLILKLAQCDLLRELPRLLRTGEHAQVFVTATARYQLLPGNADKALRKAGNEATLGSLQEFFAVAHELPAIQDEGLLTQLEELDGIDGGEQQLLAAMLELDQPILATGDKAALRAVAANQKAIPRVYASLNERVLTFESAILLAIVEFGFSNVKQRLLGSPKPDAMLRLVLRDGMQEEDLVACLVSYSRDHYAFLAGKDRIARFYEIVQ